MKVISKAISHYLQKQPPARIIALGFALVILLGAAMLKLPVSIREGMAVTWVDALFTSTSAVCVTGLIAVDTADTFTPFGQAVLAGLIQVGGLGVTSIGMGLALAAGRRINFKGRSLVREALNVDSFEGMVRLVRAVLFMTLCFELAGVVCSFPVFIQDFPPLHALWVSIFHSIAAFNNSGFDILGGLRNMIPYHDNVWLNLVTCGLIIFGGIGFLVVLDVVKCRFRFRKFTLHTKVVLTTTAVLLAAGTVLLQLTDGIGWLAAFFHSTSARTAGFSTLPLGELSNAGLFVLTALMFIGASPGSTGGGIKTTTFFVLMQEVASIFTKRRPGAFHRRLPDGAMRKAATIALLGVIVVCTGTFLLCALEPDLTLMQLLFEDVSAFGTVGLSTGITPDLLDASKLILILTMYTGRVGAFTLLSIWVERPEPSAHYTEEAITIG